MLRAVVSTPFFVAYRTKNKEKYGGEPDNVRFLRSLTWAWRQGPG